MNGGSPGTLKYPGLSCFSRREQGGSVESCPLCRFGHMGWDEAVRELPKFSAVRSSAQEKRIGRYRTYDITKYDMRRILLCLDSGSRYTIRRPCRVKGHAYTYERMGGGAISAHLSTS
jgi:hypothetical protein